MSSLVSKWLMQALDLNTGVDFTVDMTGVGSCNAKDYGAKGCMMEINAQNIMGFRDPDDLKLTFGIKQCFSTAMAVPVPSMALTDWALSCSPPKEIAWSVRLRASYSLYNMKLYGITKRNSSDSFFKITKRQARRPGAPAMRVRATNAMRSWPGPPLPVLRHALGYGKPLRKQAMNDELRFEVSDGIALVTLNRPEAYNSISSAIIDGLGQAYRRCDEDDDIRVVVVTGAGKAFCAGHDLQEMKGLQGRDALEGLFKQCSKMMTSLTRIPQPLKVPMR